jgi:lysophospholipase L1-like esterase
MRKDAENRSRRLSGIAGAIRRGRAEAAAVVAFRTRQRRKRARAVAAAPARRRTVRIPARILRTLGPPASTGVLIAEGDSWFDYPFNDVLRFLEDDHGYDIETVAHRGDRVEDMAYSGGQFEEFARRLEKLLREGRVPDAILISGGGNDIAGDEFVTILNHSASGLPALNQDVVRGVIDIRLRNAYAYLIGGLTEIGRRYLNRPIPILMHGYDYPVPDGRGVLGGWGALPGPWLQPGFHRKGHADQRRNTQVMETLMDAFNVMLDQVSRAPEFQHVQYLDLRATLANDRTYRTDWANELHPKGRGFAALAAKFERAIVGLQRV